MGERLLNHSLRIERSPVLQLCFFPWHYTSLLLLQGLKRTIQTGREKYAWITFAEAEGKNGRLCR
jgi:hypothetical protein